MADTGPVGPRAVASGISLAPVAGIPGPELVFDHDDPGAAAETLAVLGFAPELDAGGAILLRAPDGLRLRLERGHC